MSYRDQPLLVDWCDFAPQASAFRSSDDKDGTGHKNKPQAKDETPLTQTRWRSSRLFTAQVCQVVMPMYAA